MTTVLDRSGAMALAVRVAALTMPGFRQFGKFVGEPAPAFVQAFRSQSISWRAVMGRALDEPALAQ